MNDQRGFRELFDVRRRVWREETLETALGASVVGSGAAGQVAVWSAPDTVGGSADLTWDSALQLLSIATSTKPTTGFSVSAWGEIVAYGAARTAGFRATTYGISAANNRPYAYGQSARGTEALPSAVQADDVLMLIGGTGYGTTGFAATVRSQMRFLAAETWSDSVQGTYVSLFTTAIGGTSTVEAWRWSDTGMVRQTALDTVTAAVTATQAWRYNSTGTPAAGFGQQLLFQLKSSTTTNQNVAAISALWTTATHASRTAALVFSTVNNAGTIAERVRIPGPGGLVIGTAALATNATDGFLYLPTCAGTPTGVPTAFTGTIPLVYDTSNNKLYAYNGAWKSVTLA